MAEVKGGMRFGQDVAGSQAAVGATSSPTRRAYRFTMREALSSTRGVVGDLPTERHGAEPAPALISTAASYVWTVSTGRRRPGNCRVNPSRPDGLHLAVDLHAT